MAGGGPAGAATALALAHSGAEVVLVHPDSAPEWRVGESLAPPARTLLERLGVLDRVATGGHLPCYGNRSAWGRAALTTSDFVRSPYGPGWHLDRRRFDASLREAARDAGVRYRPGSVTGVTRTGNHWRATVSGAEVTASYVVDATGARARLARRIGARLVHTDHLVAITARVPNTGQGGDGSGRFEDGTEHTSLIESTPFGWWYTAPLPSGERVVMAVTDADLVGQAGLRTPDGWWAALGLSRHIGARLPVHARPPERLAVLRAGTSRALPAAGPGWAAVGDAATATDPVAARGITSALATGIAAAGALTANAGGDEDAIRRYAGLVTGVHTEFLHARAAYYRIERRWDTPFWLRRRRLPDHSPLLQAPAGTG
ncbi:NAD(P)/FAD-dependent oxidoreductase [Streptomyces sp. ISL-86]|uniref:NAD(P)/FAD-dependent oxidoreductase n=1 Tax=Streptomyces sp. ISL-86 TaxID=2819187 RepID=UPI001BE87821|nr:tryptophan 7-halogenase [Streptomyces sp. ISL-86]MBT2459154.1 tryptophan 7-halogenase [Streptomyces sp. ISL-86]